MQHLEGQTLAARLTKGALPIDQALRCAIEIASALDAAHGHGIVHRDLKPANIMMTKAGARLLDFGLAKLRAPVMPITVSGLTILAPSDPATGGGVLLGTVPYMSPEQVEGRDADPRSDIFGFGAVLYEMVTGRRAFPGATPASVIGAVLKDDPPPVSSTQPLAPPALDHVVHTCLAKEPEERWQHARDLVRELQWIAESGSAPAAGPIRGRTIPWPLIAAGTLILGLSVGAWTAARLRPVAVERPFQLQIDPPEGSRFVFGNNVGGIASSPDGRWVAFVASGNGKTGLWVRSLDSASTRLLPDTEAAAYPFWSPDSKSIGFFAHGKLERIDPDVGPPRVICDWAQPRGGAWSTDGRILLGTLAGALFQVPASGGALAPLTTLDTSLNEVSQRWPQALPDGRFLYWARTGKPETTGVYAASLAKPADHRLLVVSDANGIYAPSVGRAYLLWVRGGTLMAQPFDAATLTLSGEPQPVVDPVAKMFSIGAMNAAVSNTGLLVFGPSNPLSQFAWFDSTGRQLGVVGEPGQYEMFRLSLDGRRIVASRDRPGGSDLWLLETDRAGPGSRLSVTPGVHNLPMWSPDRRAVVFTNSRLNMTRIDVDGTGEEYPVMTDPESSQTPTDWSRDGRLILFFRLEPSTGRDLWTVAVGPDGRAAPGTKPRPYLRTSFNEGWGRFSPEANPRWVAYHSDESGREEVYVRAFPDPRNKTQISTAGGQFPQWSGDGRELFYVSPDFKLMASRLTFHADSIIPSPPRELFQLSADDIGWDPFDTVDGQRFLVRAAPPHASSLTVVVNWAASLRK
jgi:serine/threonine protein kinase